MLKPSIRYAVMLCAMLSLFAVNAQQIPRDSSYNKPHELKKISGKYPKAKLASTDLPKGVKQYLDEVYLTLPGTAFGDRNLHADIFRPDDDGIYPALIMVHGGAWKSGTKEMLRALAQRVAQRGYVTICVEYQLLLEAKYPAGLHNVKAVIRWTKANAADYGIAADKIAIAGSSAGAQLAALAGLTMGVPEMEGEMGDLSQNSDVAAIVVIDGVVDFIAPVSLNLERKPNSPDIEWLGGSFYDRPDRWREASPIYWANEKSPPILFIKSGYPRFTAGQHELVGMYDYWSIYSEVHQFDIKVHPFWLFDPWVTPAASYIEGFLLKVWGY